MNVDRKSYVFTYLLVRTEARPSARDVEKQTDKRGMMQHQHHHHQQQQQPQQLPQLQLAMSNTMSRRLQEEVRRTPVDKDSAMLLEQDMKKRSSKKFRHNGDISVTDRN